MRTRAFVIIFGLSLVSLLLLDTASVWARATSGGSRGSRSSSSPTSPSTTPSSPSRVTTPPPATSQPQQPVQRPGMFGGFMGGLAGFALGGLLGSMLFGGMGGGFGGGIGLLELVLIGGAIFLVFRMLRGRGESRPEPAYAGASAYGSADSSWSTSGGSAVMEAPPGQSDLDRGIGHIRGIDATFDPVGFTEWAKGTFADVQAGIVKRNLSTGAGP